jgi:Putative transposase
MEFAQDGKHLGGTPGFSAVLHTWTREIGYHPHLHVIMPGLALSADGLRVHRAKGKRYPFPVKALAAGFRNRVRRLIEARDAEEGTQHLAQIGRQVWQMAWVVDGLGGGCAGRGAGPDGGALSGPLCPENRHQRTTPAGLRRGGKHPAELPEQSDPALADCHAERGGVLAPVVFTHFAKRVGEGEALWVP